MTRRDLLRSAALGAAWAALPGRHGRAAIPSGIPVVPARQLRTGWGVCGRPGADASADSYASMLDLIGTRDLRMPIAGGGQSFMPGVVALRTAMQRRGMSSPLPQITALISAYRNDLATTWAVQQAVLLSAVSTGMLRGVEGPNEINNRAAGSGAHGPFDTLDRTDASSYPGNFQAWSQALQLWRQLGGSPIAQLPLIAPSIASGLPSDYANLPFVGNLVDAGNLHFYAGGGRQPDFSMAPNPAVGSFDNVLDWARAAVGTKPMWMSECGASTSGNYATSGVSQAKYLANQFFDFFAAGGQRMFFYCLADSNSASSDVEARFGLFTSTGSPKPSALMLSRLKDVLSLGNSFNDPRNLTDTGPLSVGTAPTLSYSYAPAAYPPRGLWIIKSDGSTVLAVWDEPVIDDGKGNDVFPPALDVTVAFGGQRRYRLHDLMDGSGGTAFSTGQQATVSLRGYPVLVEIAAA